MRRLTLLALGAVALAACGGSSNNNPSSSTALKAAWVYVGSSSDAGWTKAHDDARLYVQQQLGSHFGAAAGRSFLPYQVPSQMAYA